MKRIIYKILFPVAQLYWFLFRPKSSGAKCIIEHDGKLLLIKNSYGKKRWTFAGGGIKRGEQPEQAVAREIKEELNINIVSPELLGSFSNNGEHKRDNIFVFKVKVDSLDFKIDEDEIAIAQWFSIDALPELGPIASKMMDIYGK